MTTRFLLRSTTYALAALALVACRLERIEPPLDSAAAAASADSTIDAADLSTGEELTSFRRDRYFDFTGDGHAEELKIRARGERSDALEVTLRIEAPDDSVLYADRWTSDAYLKYTDARTRGDRRVVRATVQAALERVLADSAFGAAVAERLRGSAQGASRNRSEAVERDVVESIWRQRRGMPRDSAIDPRDHDSLEALARLRPDRARVQRLVAEAAKSDRYFMYHRGGEETIALVWSPTERRFVRIWHCC